MPKKVLVIDDDPDVRLFNTSVVQELGCIPLEAANGEEGQRMVAKEIPDLIVLDVMMPLQSGIRLYRALKTDAAFTNIPVTMRQRTTPIWALTWLYCCPWVLMP